VAGKVYGLRGRTVRKGGDLPAFLKVSCNK
jgi:hypothetical protein